ncbi:MAG: Ca-activated chloride channel [Pseudonocardiales bacterium]|jgi:Ca-activated chloride channel family protein|nr:Ca-activated chloride channel [Pseudonocardiales bacterium]
MHFLSPAYLWLLVAVAALLAAYVVLQLRRKRYVTRFSNVELLGSVAPRRPGWRRHLTFALLLIGLAVLSVGVARPSAAVKVPRENATVILDIDVSLSMEATDVLPSRIETAKDAGKKFVGLLPARINLGLVSFGGQASLLVPPTLNRESVKAAIGELRLQQSTAIGEAIFTSLQAIQVFTRSTTAKGDKPPPARIVLLSDGTNTVGRSVNDAIGAALKAHVQVSTIAFGTQTGTVTIDGQTQRVPADDRTLETIAQATGGTFHTAHSEQELSSVYKDIGSQIGYTTEHRDISWRFMLAGLLSLFAAGGAAMLWAGRLI